MKLIQSSVELLKQEPGLQGINKMIELAGRTCYKSEDKITEDSAEAFVQRMINSHHTAMLEHGTVYLMKSINVWPQISFNRYYRNPYSKAITKDGIIYVTTNLRVLQENNWLDDSQFLCEPTKFHEKRITLKFTTDRGVSHELVRHRVFSFAQESTRYCNYNKDKFGNEITFITPSWWEVDLNKTHLEPEVPSWYIDNEILEHKERYAWFIESCTDIERRYLLMIKNGMQPQEARQVLPNALKTEIVMTGFASDWRHFFDLRYFGKTGKPHPDMLELTTKAKQVLEENNLWDYIMSFHSKFD